MAVRRQDSGYTSRIFSITPGSIADMCKEDERKTMTREEFMKHAGQEIEKALIGQKNRIMNLVEQAWAEGKRNAEVTVFEEAGNELVEVVKQAIKLPTLITTDHVPDMTLTYTPDACKACPNHPSNGGSGVCNCIMGTQQFKC